MSAALAAVTTASVAPAIITIFITVLFLEVRRNKAVTAERSPQTRREHERRNTSTVRQTEHVRGKGLQCGRYETCGNILYLDDHSYAIKPRSGRAVLWLLRPSVRRRTCGLLRAPTPSQSGAAGSAAAWRSVAQCVSTRAPSQCTQVAGDVAEFPDHLGITENSGGRIAGATECDGADMTLLVRKRLGTHHGSVCIE